MATASTMASLSAAALSANGQATDFANFDFAGGTRYPELATASVGPAFYRPGSTVAYVPISLDRPTPHTEIGRASCRERVFHYVLISVVAVSLNNKVHHIYYFICFL